MATAAKVAVGVTVTVTANYILVSDGGTHTVFIVQYSTVWVSNVSSLN